jgi:Fe-coproporphyrin III synthase
MSPVITKLPILILFPHSRCNCRCVMCDIWKTSENAEISLADLERHAADIAALGVQWVIFSGGEPLMHSDLFSLCRLLRGMGIRLTVLSTGLLLEKHALRLVQHVDEIIVSLDGPPAVHNRIRRVAGAFEKMSDGVDAIHHIRPDFPVTARCTVQKENFMSLAATVETARKMGLQSISFLAADLTSTAFNRPEPWPLRRRSEVGLNADELVALERVIETMIDLHAKDFETGFVLESPEKLRRIVHHFRAQLGQVEPVAPRCNAPWVSAVLEADGTVRPCFFHEPIGNAGDKSLYAALNNPRALEFRQSLSIFDNAICRNCVCSLYLPEDGEVPSRTSWREIG